MAAEALWSATDIRLEHVFRLLSLSLPREPLHVAFQALHTENTYLRGTALEYLDKPFTQERCYENQGQADPKPRNHRGCD
jgi:hypothetical protein